MAKAVDRAVMTVSAVAGGGTGALTLNAAVTKYQTFAAAGVVNGDVVSYVIEDGANWEAGDGTYSSTGPTLTRTTVIAGSDGTSPIAATTGAIVYITSRTNDVVATHSQSLSAGQKTQACTNIDAVSKTVTGQAISGGFTSTAYSRTWANHTADSGLGDYQYGTNSGAITITAPAADGGFDMLVTNGAAAGAITFSGFTVGSNTGDPYVTTNAYKFILSIRRINGVSTYTWKALQ